MKRKSVSLLIFAMFLLLMGCSGKTISSQSGDSTEKAGQEKVTEVPKTTAGAESDKSSETTTNQTETPLPTVEMMEPTAAPEPEYEPIKLEIKDYIQSAIDYAGKIGGEGMVIDAQGNIFLDNSNVLKLYYCYGKNISQIMSYGGVYEFLIYTEEGELFHNMHLVSSGLDVSKMMRRTPKNSREVPEILLSNGMSCVYRGGYGQGFDELNDARSLLADGKGTLAVAVSNGEMIALDGEGNFECTGVWEKCEVKNWKDIVVLACSADEDGKPATIAGISADGTVYATGDYAEDILSWGELAYITMNDELIVGMKRDGSLVFSGKNGEAFSAIENIRPVKGVKIDGYGLYGITEDGVFQGPTYSVSAYIDYSSMANPGDGFGMVMDNEGNIYEKVTDGAEARWELSTYPKAGMQNVYGVALYFSVLNDYGDYEYYEDMDMVTFLPCDIYNDGIQEVIIKTYQGDRTKMKLYANHGCLDDMLFNFNYSSVEGYYPEAGVAVVTDVEEEKTWTRYILLEDDWGRNDVIAAVLYEGSTVTYRVYNGAKTEDVSEEDFYKTVAVFVNGEVMQEIDHSQFMEITKENCAAAFLK